MGQCTILSIQGYSLTQFYERHENSACEKLPEQLESVRMHRLREGNEFER